MTGNYNISAKIGSKENDQASNMKYRHYYMTDLILFDN